MLTYTSIIRKVDSGIRATRSELGTRYEVKYGCIIALFSNPNTESQSLRSSLSIGKYPEFGKNHSSYTSILNLKGSIENETSFTESVKDMLAKPITVLDVLTEWQINKLHEAGIDTIDSLYNTTEEELINRIYNVGPARARVMKNAATAELLEYLSG